MADYGISPTFGAPSGMSMASPSDFTATPAASGGGGMSSAAMLLPALVSFLGTSAAAGQIRSQSRATIANIKSAGQSLKFSQHGKAQQFVELQRAIGDKLSASGLEALERESRLRAASAETGVSGNSQEEVIANSYMEENFRSAAILREADLAKHSLKQSMVADRLSFENETASMISGMASPRSAMLNTISGGLQGFSSGLNFMTQADREKMFMTDQGSNA